MSIEILMPALSPTMEEGTLAKWLVKEGDTVQSGDVIAEIETDKATMEVEAVDEGLVAKLLIAEGTEGVAVNTIIAQLLADGETALSSGLDDSLPSSKTNPPRSDAKASEDVNEREMSAHQPERAVPKAPVSMAPPPEPEWTGATKQQTLREALRDAMAEEMRTTPEVFVMGEEVAEYQGAYKVTQGLLDEFGADRVIDTPITEHGFTGIGIGAAFAGMKPIVEFMTFNFAMQAMDQIINSAAKTRYMSGGQLSSPIVFRGPNGAAARVGAQHSQCYAAWYGHIPGLKVISPYSAADAKGLLKAAIRDPDPVIFLENELLYGDTFDVPDTDDWVVPIGKAKVATAGSDVTIVAHGMMVKKSLAAAQMLADQGISAEVVDLRTIRPLDTDTIVRSIQKTNRLVVAEEGWGQHGIGAEIAARVMEQAFDWLDAPVARVYQADVPLPYAANLERLSLPQAEDVVQAAKRVCYQEG